MEKPTESEPNPNISTEHQSEGDARRPSDVLDRKNVKRDPDSGAPIPSNYDPKAQERKEQS